jgi:hypothetical protein
MPMTRATAMQSAARIFRGDMKSAADVVAALIKGGTHQTYAGDPTSNLTPLGIGDVCFDSTNGDFYKAVTAASTGWRIMSASTLLATVAEINRVADVSTRLVAAGATETITVAGHGSRTTLLDTAGGSVCTLPAATGTGEVFEFVVSVRPSGGSHIIKVASASDFMAGQIHMIDLDSNAVTGYAGDGSADDTITINNTTTGGAIGDRILLRDTLLNVWTVLDGKLSIPTGSNVADPFSATV